MRNNTGNRVRVESWSVSKNGKTENVRKVAVRGPNGQFHGATNFRGTVLR